VTTKTTDRVKNLLFVFVVVAAAVVIIFVTVVIIVVGEIRIRLYT
jgi:hypothetical protein